MSGSRTRLFAVLGDPVSHSLSPAIHTAAFRVLGVDAEYLALRCSPNELPGLMRLLARNGGGGNVTVPHKSVAAAALDRAAPLVQTLTACNTFWGDNGALAGDNTDVAGVLRAVESLDVPDGPWLVVGSGGSARAVARAAAERGVTLAVRSRDGTKATEFSAWAASIGAPPAPPELAVLVVNATPLGLGEHDPLPIEWPQAPCAVAVLDLVYGRGGTPFTRGAHARGLRASDGRVMLVAQGAAALERWFPGISAPVDAMHAAVDVALR